MATQGREEAKNVRVLVVDDDPLTRKVHRALVHQYGLQTEQAENGKQAVDIFLAGETFELVIMDMEMPIMDGIQATQRLRDMGVTSMIIGVTAQCKNQEEAFMKAGLDFCMEKPLNAKLLIPVLDRLDRRTKTLPK